MGKGNVQEIREIMKGFDPLLVAVAIGEIGVKSRVIAKEVADVKAAFSKYDKKLVAEVASAYISDNSIMIDCGGPVCICPENGGCGRFAVRFDERAMRELGFSVTTAIQDLKTNTSANAGAVLGVDDKLGYIALCIDSVRCTGRTILVMHACRSALFAFDILDEVINPIEVMQTIARSNPTLTKRVNAMVDAMKKAGELPK